MEDAGQKLRRARERLNLRVRDVEEASQKIAEKYHNDEFTVLINRLSEIENRGLVPSLYKLYSLCAIYRLDFHEVMEWYGISLPGLAVDALLAQIPETHPIGFRPQTHGEVLLPLSLDPGIDLRRTTYLSRMIQRWGKVAAAVPGEASAQRAPLRLHRDRGLLHVSAAAAGDLRNDR